MLKGIVGVEGMSCKSCKRKIEQAVMQLHGIEAAEVNLMEKHLYIEFDDNLVSFERIKQVVEGHRYHVSGCGLKQFD